MNYPVNPGHLCVSVCPSLSSRCAACFASWAGLDASARRIRGAPNGKSHGPLSKVLVDYVKQFDSAFGSVVG